MTLHFTARNNMLEEAVQSESAQSRGQTSSESSKKLLSDIRQKVRRFSDSLKVLPYQTMATCPGCGQQVAAEFRRSAAAKNMVELLCQCETCGPVGVQHHDTIWHDPASDRNHSARHTYSGEPIKGHSRYLPRTVQTLCPECSGAIVGRIFIADDMVLMEKHCPEHGYVRDILNRDVRLYCKSLFWTFEELAGLQNPARPARHPCPSDCGLCGRHQSGACLANIDLTNRCNLNCPICFANANVKGYVYEPEFDQVVGMLQALRDMRPTPATAVQFSGGEPTLHPRFLDIIARASRMGFSNIQIATNGLKMADTAFARQAKEAGLHTLYLQFDGIGDEVYRSTRGRDLWDIKQRVVDNCREVDLKICLVPTVIRTVNDDQVEPIFRYAVDHIDVISAISYQPVCFSGRIDTEQRLRQRYTLGDLAHDIARASGSSLERDFYPLSIVVPLSQLLEVVTGDPKIKPSSHADCAFGTYFLVDEDKNVTPFPKVIDIEAFFSGMNRLSHAMRRRAGKLNMLDKLRLYMLFRSVFRKDQAPAGLTIKRFTQALEGMVDKNKGRGQPGARNYRTLMAAGMHFQDRYNYDVERVKRCVIPYSTPAGLFPFCAYNCGPTYREAVEQGFALK